MLKHFLKADGSFRLEALLQQKPPLVSDQDKFRFHLAADVPEIDVRALSYFAMSVFWRGSIYPWNTDGSIPVPLGPYGERVRRYLLCHAAFPEDLALHVYVRDAKNLPKLLLEPTGGRFNGAWAYRFVVPGMMFVLYVGKAISAMLRQYCFVNGEANPLVVTTVHEPFLENLVRHLLQEAKIRGAAERRCPAPPPPRSYKPSTANDRAQP